jgi:hypothetical protein
MYHEGLRLGLPDFSPDPLITSRGSVGLEKSLDFVLAVPATLVEQGSEYNEQISHWSARYSPEVQCLEQ